MKTEIEKLEEELTTLNSYCDDYILQIARLKDKTEKLKKEITELKVDINNYQYDGRNIGVK